METSKLLFCYGILKRGLAADLSQFKGTVFIGEAFIPGAELRAINSGVGLRFNGDPLEVAQGEVWEIPNEMWGWLDHIESNGKVYTRKIVTATIEDGRDGLREVECWVYEHTLWPDEFYQDRLTKIEDGCFMPT